MSDEIEQLVSNVEALHAWPDDLVVLTCPVAISDETRERLRWELSQRLPGRQVLVLGDGMQVVTLGQHLQLNRIERSLSAITASLGAMLQALHALQEEPAPEARTLDGDLFPSGERDQTRPL